MIYIQNGPSWRPKALKIIDENNISGIIWDPRSESLERVIQSKSENAILSSIDQLVDTKCYYRQFPNSDIKKLGICECFPDETIDRAFFREESKVIDLIKETFNYQIKYNVKKLFLPSLYLTDLNSRLIDYSLDMVDMIKKINTDYEGYDKYLSFTIQENAYNNKSDIDSFIEDISSCLGIIKGIYIVIDRDKEDSYRHDFNPDRLANIMWMNNSFKEIGFDLIYGYTDLESLLYAVSGVEKFGVGWFHSLRRFNAERQGLQNYDGQGRQLKRYTSLKLLYGVKIEDSIINANREKKEEILSYIVGNSEKDLYIKNLSSIENISLNDTYSQHFEAMINLTDFIIEKNSYQEKIDSCLLYLDEVISNIDKHNNPENNVLESFTKSHVINYKLALEKFKEMILL